MSENDTEVIPQRDIDAACLRVVEAINALTAAQIAFASKDVMQHVYRAQNVFEHMVETSTKRHAPPRRPSQTPEEDHGSRHPICA